MLAHFLRGACVETGSELFRQLLMLEGDTAGASEECGRDSGIRGSNWMRSGQILSNVNHSHLPVDWSRTWRRRMGACLARRVRQMRQIHGGASIWVSVRESDALSAKCCRLANTLHVTLSSHVGLSPEITSGHSPVQQTNYTRGRPLQSPSWASLPLVLR